MLEQVSDHVGDHILREGHVVLEVRKGDLGLDHPELRRVPRGVGALGTEGGAEGVDLAEGHGHALGRELPRHGQGGVASEKSWL